MTGYEALEERAAWIDLSMRGKLRVTGEDRARLLHAMCTNDIQNLGTGEGVYVFFLTAQGRIVADAYVYNLGETIFLDTEPEVAATLSDHLDKYIIADDVAVNDETPQWAAIGLEGPSSNEVAADLGIPIAGKKYGVVEWGAGFVAHVSASSTEGVRIFLPLDQKQTMSDRLAGAQVPTASAEEARIVRLENGIPRYGEDITDRYLVQETQQLHAIHTNKGCYLGQEIVERVRSRGQVHRLLSSIRLKSSAPPAPGTKLSRNGKEVAAITSAAYSPRLQQVAVLAYVRTEAATAGEHLTLTENELPVDAVIA